MATVSLRPTALFLVVVVAATAVVGQQSLSACSCYRTSSNDFFTNHRFYDFRNVASYSDTAPPLQSTLPASADDQTGQSTDDVGSLQSGFISSSDWTQNWSIQDWGKGRANDTKYRMWNSLSNVFVDGNADGNPGAKSKLVLRTRRFSGFQSAAEVENQCVSIAFCFFCIFLHISSISCVFFHSFVFFVFFPFFIHLFSPLFTFTVLSFAAFFYFPALPFYSILPHSILPHSVLVCSDKNPGKRTSCSPPPASGPE